MPYGPILALDTSGSFCSVAVMAIDGTITLQASPGTSRTSTAQSDHFEQLPRLIRNVCDNARVKVQELTALRVGLGPGSFTGLRIGMSFAKGMATALRIPLVGVCSFRAAAIAASRKIGTPCAVNIISDARRDELFFGSFDVDATGCRSTRVPAIVSTGKALELARGNKTNTYSPERGLLLNGSEVNAISSIAEGVLLENGDNASFSIERIAALEPTYIRGVSAQSIAERKLARGSGELAS